MRLSAEYLPALSPMMNCDPARVPETKCANPQAGGMGKGQTVLVTAAAGGTGQLAVQLAKLAGNTVIGTCGGPAKARADPIVGDPPRLISESPRRAPVLTAPLRVPFSQVEMLKKLGCDRLVDYRRGNLNEVLKNEFPRCGIWAFPPCSQRRGASSATREG